MNITITAFGYKVATMILGLVAFAAIAITVAVVMRVTADADDDAEGSMFTASEERCMLTAACLMTNGWTDDDWANVYQGALAGADVSDTLAACLTDAMMLRGSPQELLSLSQAEIFELGVDIGAHECLPVLYDEY